VCSQFNDLFVGLVTPPPPGAIDGNVSFDSLGNSISINTDLLRVCQPQTASDGGMAYLCPLGTGLLTGTGFELTSSGGPHGATGWLQSQASVVPGSTITLRFAIWDSGDEVMDSTVLIDRFAWMPDPLSVATTPVANPK
jgi:hypothetical protein